MPGRLALFAAAKLLLLAVLPLAASQPVAEWTFDDGLPADVHGAVKQGPGPRAPYYPDFGEDNIALALRAPAWLRIVDEPEGSRFDFDNGDSITLEAWVKPTAAGENMYIIGKGRTSDSGPKSLNQNWALRLRTLDGQPRLNFLFRSAPHAGSPGDWHRWTSDAGVAVGQRWHHVAISYTFGEPKSIRGYLDGQPVTGSWDMGGETRQRPVVDDDDVWIGSTMAGNPRNSFQGALDNIALHRRIVPAEEIRDRYHWQPPKEIRPEIPAGKVVVQLFGPVESISAFPEWLDAPLMEWQQDELAFVRVPQRYDSWGVRADWGSTLLLRAWTEIDLAPGEYQLLARSRGLGRLEIDGREVLRTAVQRNRSGAHHVVDDLPSVPVAGMRPHWMNDTERVSAFQSRGGKHLLRYEMIIGGPRYRVELGEPCVAIARPGEMFRIVSSVSQFPLTDQGWWEFADRQHDRMNAIDRDTRRAANRQQAEYWTRRHAWAKQQLLSDSAAVSIDQAIDSRIAQINELAKQAPATTDDAFFVEHVQPILDSHCVRCHGEKQKGELSIRSRDVWLRGGESGQPAIVPGKPADSYLLELVSAARDEYRMPPKGDGLSEAEVQVIRKWIKDGAAMPARRLAAIESPPLVDDFTFLRRVYLDCVGVPPTLSEVQEFLDDESADRRERVVDRLLQDDRWADNWVGYWQDVLAENPNLLKPTLNNTGPFRWWIHEALVDNKSIDRFTTELMLMRGSTWGGGSAGFAIASQNDVPMAAKAHVVGAAFLGVNLKCARCHDAPYHQWKQSDLFQLAAMLERKPLKLPASSTVPAAFFEQKAREPLIDATLRPGTVLENEWPFSDIPTCVTDDLLIARQDSRERLAAHVTTSRRFAEVIANRFWQRFMGTGIVEPVDDWEGNPPSNRVLLDTLANTLIASDYDVKELARSILNSRAYQRQAIDPEADVERVFAAPHRRRMSAEQIVDSAFHVVGQTMRTEPLTMDIEGTLPANKFLHFGYPRRAWEFTTLANERDRPSLALPRAQAVVDLLKAFGWRDSRPEPTSERDEAPNLIQPAVLSNGVLGTWLTRLSDESSLTQLALREQEVEELVDQLFMQILTRKPTREELAHYSAFLREGYAERRVPDGEVAPPAEPKRFRYVSWSNHLNTEANKIKIEMEMAARQGDPPSRFLRDEWRQRAEDVVWALLNSPEMILIP